MYPTVFSDFVSEKEQVTIKHNLQFSIERINGFNSKKLTIVFTKGYNQKEKPIVTYYLNGSDVTADFKNFDN